MSNQNQSIEQTVKDHDIALYGKEGELGMTHKVAVIWRVHVWLLCLVSGMVGAGIAHFLKL